MTGRTWILVMFSAPLAAALASAGGWVTTAVHEMRLADMQELEDEAGDYLAMKRADDQGGYT